MAEAEQTAACPHTPRSPLQQGDDLFRLFVESVQDYAMFTLDPEGYVRTWNAGAQRIKGYAASEIIGRHFSTFFRPEDRWKCDAELAAARDTGRALDEGWRVRKDGSVFWAGVVITALRNDAGDLIGFAKVTRDLTERRMADEQLRESEERFRLLIESVQDYAIFMLDPGGYVQTWNGGAQRIKGYAAADIIGRHFSTFYPRADVEAGKCEMELEVAGREGRFEDEGWRLRKDGTRFWANVIITALRHPSDGRLVGFAKVTRDLTERRRAESERLRLARAEEANRTKDEFLATVSHELRTPLNAILGWAVLLADRVDDPTIAKPLATIRRNAEAQAKLVEDVLDISRIVSGKLRLEVAPVDLTSVVRDALDVVRPAAQAKDIRFLVDGLDAPATVIADATRLQQVAWNLLSNAVKFTSPGGTVTVRLDHEPTTVSLSIVDTGIGIEPAFLPHVFERFRQADGSPTRKHGGLGLGLAIVRHIVELHGGTVTAASEGAGKGATFVVTLPVRAAATAQSGPSSKAPLRAPLAGVDVLVVDDEDDARELVQHVLVGAGATVRAAASAAEARRLVQASLPDVLLSDIAMPEEDGYALVRWLRADAGVAAGMVRAVALSAHAADHDRARALEAGFDDHLAKPVDPREIVQAVRDVVRR